MAMAKPKVKEVKSQIEQLPPPSVAEAAAPTVVVAIPVTVAIATTAVFI